MTHTEHQMSEALYNTATKMGDKCNYKLVKAKLVEEFGEAAFNRFKLTAQRDLASLDELRRIKGKSLNKAESNPWDDREILSKSLRSKPAPHGASRFSIHDTSRLLSTSISTPISRKVSSAYTMHQKVKDRSMSSFSSPQVTSVINQIVKNDLGHVVYASLPAMINVIATTIEDELRDEYLQTILLTYKQYTSFSVILSEVLNQLDIAVTSEYYTKRRNLTCVFKALLEYYMNRFTKQHSDFASVMQETESLLLYKMDNANGNDEWRFWDGLIQYFFDLQKPVESRSPATRRSGDITPSKTKSSPKYNSNGSTDEKARRKTPANDAKLLSDGTRILTYTNELEAQSEHMFPSNFVSIMLQHDMPLENDRNDKQREDKSRTPKSTLRPPVVVKRSKSTPTMLQNNGLDSPLISPPLLKRQSSENDLGSRQKYINLAKTSSMTIASQLTLMAGACFKRITAEEMVDKDRSKTQSYKTILALYHMLAKFVQDEFLREGLDLTERVDIFIKFIKIAHKCAELGNFFCCLCIVSCFNRKLFPDQLWERIPAKAKVAYENLNKTFVVSGREGYDAALRAFRKKFYIPDFRPVLHHLSQKLDRLPSINNGMINFGKFVSIYRLLCGFLSNQSLEVQIEANRDVQERIVWTLNQMAKKNDTIFDMKRFTNLKESVRNLVMCEQLDQLGFG
eukprot:g3870.t1